MRLFLLLAAVSVGSLAFKDYKNYKVVQVVPQNEHELAVLDNMEKSIGSEVDFWKRAKKAKKAVDFMVSESQFDLVTAYLKKQNVQFKVVVKDVSQMVERSMTEAKSAPTFSGDDPSQFQFDKYHSHDEINAYVQAVANMYSSFVTMGNLGKSHENRDMLYLKIGTPSNSSKNALFFDAGIHAREWVAPATALYTINQLVTGYATTYKTLLDSIDIYVAPSINPDGYEYTRSSDRMWRKTRSGPRSGCYGVDPNRNWSFHWGESGTSNNPCSEIYRGPSAFSEIECSNLKTFLDANAQQIKGYLTLHSYGEDWIYPWGYATHTYPPDVQELRALGLQSAAAIQAVHGTRYTVDNSADDLYPAAGASDDYSKSIGVKWVYTVELRPGDGDNDNDHWYGFDLPDTFIMPTATEAFAGFMVVANRIMTGPN